MDVFPYSKNTFIPCFVFATIALHVWFLGQNISEWVPPTIFGGPWSFHNVFRIYLTMMKRFECQPFSPNPQYFLPKAFQTFPKIESWCMWHETYWCIWSLTGACRERGKGRREEGGGGWMWGWHLREQWRSSQIAQQCTLCSPATATIRQSPISLLPNDFCPQ